MLFLGIHRPNQEVVGTIHQKYYEHLMLDANKNNKKFCVEICLTKQDLFRTKSLSVETRLHSVFKLGVLHSAVHYYIVAYFGQDCGLRLLPLTIFSQ